jgi:hypothetical protein
VFVIEKLGTAIWWGLNLHVNVTNLEFDEKGEMYEEELLRAESEHDGTAEQDEQIIRSPCYSICSTNEIFG